MKHERIAINPAVMGGKPCIAGTRIPVELILEKLVAGMSYEHLLTEHPRLVREDILAVTRMALEMGIFHPPEKIWLTSCPRRLSSTNANERKSI